MSRILSFSVVACLLVAGGAAAIARSPQDSTSLPGQPTQARVWIQNRGEAEAIPVSIHEAAVLRVELAGVPTVTVAPGTALQARAVRQQWEYRALRLVASQNSDAALNAAGDDGWETTGIAIPDQAATVVIMKRPR
jgi:hypothetical protein